MMLFAGLDTSCYATSLAFLDNNRQLVWEKRIPLQVQEGCRGLRQSEMVFQHIKNLPLLWEQAQDIMCGSSLTVLAFSSKPRPLPGSYMPVFKVSQAFGKSIALAAGSKQLETSHQEGHVAAGSWSSGLQSKRFLVAHLSGGTTELLKAADKRGGYLIKIIGGTLDLNAGQFVDRVGVAMGMPFPAGPYLEKMALNIKRDPVDIPLAVKGPWFSFSGPATYAERLIAKGESLPSIARGVELCIARTLAKAVKSALKNNPAEELLLVGGVAANAVVRQELLVNLKELRIFSPAQIYAGDNAVGLAYLAYLCWRESNK